MRSPVLRNWFLEKSWPPLVSLVLSRIGFLTLPLFELLFYVRGLCIPLLEDRCCHTVPEAARFVGELLVFGGDDFRDGPERLEVYELAGFGILFAVLVQLLQEMYVWGANFRAGECVEDLLVPAAFDSSQDVRLRNIFDSRLTVVFWVILKHDAVDSILCFA